MVAKVFTGGEALAAKLKELSANIAKAASVDVGFIGNKGNTAYIASIQEFGAPSKGIPPRPFFRDMIAKQSGHWGDDTANALKATAFDSAKALDLIGTQISGELRQSIVDLTEPPLSPVTLLLRERFQGNPGDITFADVQQARRDIASGTVPNVTTTQTKPLIWTGAMLNSIEHLVKTT